MKTIDYYMNLTYRLEIIPDLTEGGYASGYPDLPGCITVGETLESFAKNASDAKKAWLEAALADGVDIAEPLSADN